MWNYVPSSLIIIVSKNIQNSFYLPKYLWMKSYSVWDLFKIIWERGSGCQELWRVLGFTLLARSQVSLPQFYGCWQKMWNPWVRSKGLYYSLNSKQHDFHIHIRSLLLFKSCGAKWSGPGGGCASSGFASQLGTPEFWEPESFIMGSKYTCLTLPQREILSLLYWSVNKSALSSEERHYLYCPILFTIQASLKRVPNKAVSTSGHKICRNTRDPWRIVPQQWW